MTENSYSQPAPLSDTVAAALRRAFNLGQTYWQQADSESYSQNAKSDITRSKFDALVEETTAAVSAIQAPEGGPALTPDQLADKCEAWPVVVVVVVVVKGRDAANDPLFK